MAIFDGKHGSIEPRPDPARYISFVVKSEYTMLSDETPRLSKYPLNRGAYTHILSTRGMPTRNLERAFIRAIRRFTDSLQPGEAGMASRTRAGWPDFQTL